ncbi:ATP-grasp domain-containing protein [Actinomadura sp. NPDC047616]|uniref:ATP-grasp domain-containing protein n=1 Tax=Actinomadura sp. NPDC047616 TaxID=3155914 RepID=UPI0033FBC1DF
MAPPTETHHVVVSRSVHPWFRYFCSAPPRNVHYVSDRAADRDRLEAELRRTRAETVVFHSSHVSLPRDIDVAAALRRQGTRVVAQNPGCAELGLDKVATRRFLRDLSIPVPPDPPARSHAEPTGRWVIKRRYGTEGDGMRLVDGPGLAGMGAGEYAERFVDGREFSVLACADGARVVTLPIVDKGRSRPDLLPPFRRPRVCPAPDLEPRLQARMLEITEAIVAAAACAGWIEVEFVLGGAGEPLVLEINPRLAGTVRVSAMAAGVRVFDLPVDPDARGHLAARSLAVEVPWTGPPVLDPQRHTFATSRLTVSGADRREIAERLAVLGLGLGAGADGHPEIIRA